jgi:hypothetical protein
MSAKLEADDWLGDVDDSEDEALESKQHNPLDTPVDSDEKLSDNVDGQLAPFLEVRKHLLKFQTILQLAVGLLYTVGTALFVDTGSVHPPVSNATK